MGFLFGSPGGYTWGKQESKDLYGRYMGLGDELYGPEAYRRNVSHFTSDLANNYQNWLGARNQNLAGRGFRGSSTIGVPKFVSALAQYQAQERARLGQGRLGFYNGALPFLSTGMQANHKNPTQGFAQQLAQMAGAYYGAGG